MAKFFVGQRVVNARRSNYTASVLKKESTYTPGIPIGTLGRITKLGVMHKAGVRLQFPSGAVVLLAKDIDCYVLWDGYDERCGNTDSLEPVLYDGDQLSEYSYTELLDKLNSGELTNVPAQ